MASPGGLGLDPMIIGPRSTAGRFRRVRSALLLVGALGLAAGDVSANCGAEGCPFAPQGPEASHGRFALDFGYQFVEQDRMWQGEHEISSEDALAEEGGAGHVLEQLTRTNSYLVTARAGISNRLALTATLPWIDRIHTHTLEHHTGYFIPSTWHITGVGDAIVLAYWTAYAAANPMHGALITQLGVKLPTGVRHAEEVNGEEPEPTAMPGTGSTDLLVGAQYNHPLRVRTLDHLVARAPLSLSVNARFNGRGTDGYQVGDEVLTTLAGGYPVTRRIQLLMQITTTHHQPDDVGNTDANPHSTGSFAALAAPGLQAEILPGVSAFGYYQFRLYQHTNGPQLVAPYHLSFGIGYSLGF
jgi:hypothetical protein